jgi:hypothetical protein
MDVASLTGQVMKKTARMMIKLSKTNMNEMNIVTKKNQIRLLARQDE